MEKLLVGLYLLLSSCESYWESLVKARFRSAILGRLLLDSLCLESGRCFDGVVSIMLRV